MDLSILVKQSCQKAEQLFIAGNIKDAYDISEQVLRVDNSSREAKIILALCLSNLRRVDEAISIIPEDEYNNIGLILSQNNRIGAIESFRKAGSSELIQTNIALEHMKAKDYSLAEEILAHGNTQLTKFNYGAFLYGRKRFAEAKEAYLRCGELPIAKHNIGATQMFLGEYSEAWKSLENRFEAFPRLAKIRDCFALPWGEGSDTVYFNEQGLGDFVQFQSYLPENACVAVQPFIQPLAKYMGYRIWQENTGKSCISMLSLATLRDRKEKTFTFPTPSFLEDTCLLRVGLCWAGSPVNPRDHERNMSLESFKYLSRLPGTKWYDLSMRQEEIPGITNLTHWVRNAFDLACLVASMDVIVSVDTAVAHLGGVSGKKTYLLLPWLMDWRWNLPWYESVEIIQQRNEGDWREVIDRLCIKVGQK